MHEEGGHALGLLHDYQMRRIYSPGLLRPRGGGGHLVMLRHNLHGPTPVHDRINVR